MLAMKSDILVAALLNVLNDVFEYYAPEGSCADPYIVWQPEGEGSEVAGDNQKQQYSMRFSVDVFSKRPIPETLKKLETAFNAARISYALNTVEYDTAKEIIDYTYEVEI